MPMHKNYTPENLLQLIYSETSGQEHCDLLQEILVNNQFSDEYYKLKTVTEMLPAKKLEPSATSLKIIMDYCRSQTLAG